jgi:hypothetical protein
LRWIIACLDTYIAAATVAQSVGPTCCDEWSGDNRVTTQSFTVTKQREEVFIATSDKADRSAPISSGQLSSSLGGLTTDDFVLPSSKQFLISFPSGI